MSNRRGTRNGCVGKIDRRRFVQATAAASPSRFHASRGRFADPPRYGRFSAEEPCLLPGP